MIRWVVRLVDERQTVLRRTNAELTLNQLAAHAPASHQETRMSQFARWEGWLEVAGKRYEIKPEEWWGQRDHSWGIRSEMMPSERSSTCTTLLLSILRLSRLFTI